MAGVTRPGSSRPPLPGRVGAVVETCLASYSEILFTPSRRVGALLLAATWISPVHGALGMLAVTVSMLVARGVGFAPATIRSGLYGYSALLVALGVAAQVQPGPGAVLLVIALAAASVLTTAAFHSALGAAFNLPSLSLPFVVVHWMAGALIPSLVGLPTLPWTPVAGLLDPFLPASVAAFLRALGAIFFLPRADVGLVVGVALGMYSRVALLLAALGYAVALALGSLVTVGDPTLPLAMQVNALLAAVAMGSVWFLPQASAFGLAVAAAGGAALVTVAGQRILGSVGLPIVILPFNLTVLPLLYAMRQRVRDARPKSVDVAVGNPEENLHHYLTRRARFGQPWLIRFALPFRGRWTCTQGVDGPHTHRDAWRVAFDFEVAGADGAWHRGTGQRVEEYHAWGLPILASADGTVARVVDNQPDGRAGEVVAKDPWGNLVVLYHAPGLYSVVAHLQRGSIKVREGQFVRRGEVLGACGSSGRSPRPHVHFQLQGTDRVGAATLAAAFSEVVRTRESGDEGVVERLEATLVPDQGDVLRNVDPQHDLERLFAFPADEPQRFEVDLGSARSRIETWRPEIDLYGTPFLSVAEAHAVLYYEYRPPVFTVWDVVGGARTGLHIAQLALPRVPYEAGVALTWRDRVDVRALRPWPRRVLGDLFAPFLHRGGLEVEYTATRTGDELCILGRSLRADRSGRPLLETEAVLQEGVGLQRFRATLDGRPWLATRVPEPASADSAPNIENAP